MNAAQVLARTPQITYRQIDVWCSKGYLQPDHQGGTGHHRHFSGDEVRVVRMMARLVAAGLTPAAAHRVARGQQLAPGVTASTSPASGSTSLCPRTRSPNWSTSTPNSPTDAP